MSDRKHILCVGKNPEKLAADIRQNFRIAPYQIDLICIQSEAEYAKVAAHLALCQTSYVRVFLEEPKEEKQTLAYTPLQMIPHLLREYLKHHGWAFNEEGYPVVEWTFDEKNTPVISGEKQEPKHIEEFDPQSQEKWLENNPLFKRVFGEIARQEDEKEPDDSQN